MKTFGPVEAGHLRQRIRIERPAESVESAYGGSGISWGLLAERWASVEPLRGSEMLEADQVAGRVSHVVRFRSIAGLELGARDRILFGERVFQIVAALDLRERDRLTEVLCLEDTD